MVDFDLDTAFEVQPLNPPQAAAPGDFDLDSAQEVDVPPSMVFHEETGKTIQVPAGVNGDEAVYLTQTQVQGMPKDQYYGTTYLKGKPVDSEQGYLEAVGQGFANLGKGAANFAVQTIPRLTGALTQEFGERGVSSATRQYEPSLSDIFLPISVDPRSAVNQTKAAAYTRVAEAGQKLVGQGEQWVKDMGLERPGEDAGFVQNLLFDIGSGLGSVGASIAMTMLTRNPSVAAGFFGAIQKGNTYLEGRERGFNPEQAGRLSTNMGVVNGALEALGGGLFLKIGEASTPLRRLAGRMVEESIQEASQQAAEEVQASVSDLRDTTLLQGLKNVAYAGMVGAAAGAPVAAVVELTTRQAREEGVPEEQAVRIAERLVENGEETANLVADEMEKGLDQIASNPEGQKQAAEILKRFMDGQPVSEDVEQYISRNPRGRMLEDAGADPLTVSGRMNFGEMSMDPMTPDRMVPRETSRVDALRERMAEPVDVQGEILSGRLRLLDSQVDSIDRDIDQLMVTMDTREAEGRPNAANTNRLNRLLAQRDRLDGQRADIMTRSQAEPDMVQQVMDRAMGREQVQVRGNTLTRLAERITNDRSRALEAGLREGRRMALTDVAAAQDFIVNTLEESGLTPNDKAKFIRSVKNIQTQEDAVRELPIIQSRIGRLLEQQAQREAKAELKKLLEKTKVTKQSGKPVGKFTADLQTLFDKLRASSKLKAGAAGDLLDARLESYETPDNVGPTPEDAIENAVLSIMSDRHEVHSGTMRQTLETIQELVTEGRAAGLDRLLERQERVARIKQDAYQALTGDTGNRFREFENRLRMQLVAAGMEPEEAATNALATRAAYQSFMKKADGVPALEEVVTQAFERLTVQQAVDVPAGEPQLFQSLRETDLNVDELIKAAQESSTYEDFRRSVVQAHLTDLSNQGRHRFGRALTPYADEPYQDISQMSDEAPGVFDNFRYEDQATYAAMNAPGDSVTIYRAVPREAGDQIRIGDYVALTREYAQMHAESVLEGEQQTPAKIVSARVPKSDVVWGQAAAQEWAYSPRSLRDNYPSLREVYDAVKGGADQLLFQFAGYNAETADRNALMTAEVRLARGEDPELIRRETGWARGIDGQWRYEISDAEASIRPGGQLLRNGIDLGKEGTYPLGRVLAHEKLFAAYPDLFRVKLRIDPTRTGGASYEVTGDTMNIATPATLGDDKFLSVLLHEIQHAIQNREGFARGSNMDRALSDLAAQRGPAPNPDVVAQAKALTQLAEGMEGTVDEAADAFRDRATVGPNVWQDAAIYLAKNPDRLRQAEIDLQLRQSPQGAYLASAGEIEARNTQARRNLTDEERRATPPQATEDIDRRNAVVVFSDGTTADAPQALVEMPSDVDPFGFYRKASRVAQMKLPTNGTPEQMRQQLEAYARNGDFKAEELEYSGVLEWLGTQEGRVDKNDVVSFLRDGGVKLEETTLTDITDTEGDIDYDLDVGMIDEAEAEERRAALQAQKDAGGVVKYGGYQLPGGANYREVLMRLPNPEANRLNRRRNEIESLGLNATPEQKQEWVDIMNRLDPQDDDIEGISAFRGFPDYNSSHYSQPNILAHFRLNDRTDEEGNNILFIEEIQSDWHQAGRKRGYTDVAAEKSRKMEWESKRDELDENRKRARDVYASLPQPDISNIESIEDIPPMTEEQNKAYDEWQAAEAAMTQHYANVPLSTGSVPDAPFKKTWQELAIKRILRLATEGGYDKVAWTTGEQQAARYDLSKQLDSVLYDEGTKTLIGRKEGYNAMEHAGVEPDRLDDYVGKEVALKLRDAPVNRFGMRELSGIDLKVGGEGMKGFYDNILVKAVQKIASRYDKGAKVGETQLDTRTAAGQTQRAAGGGYATGGIANVHSLDLTNSIKQGVMEGQELFQREGATPRGSIALRDEGAVIRLFEAANRSTFLHETGHFYWNLTEQLAAQPDAPAALREEMAAVRNHVGATGTDPMTTDQLERIAEDFEKYLETGEAPTPVLRRAFEAFKQWLSEVYAAIRGRNLNISPEMKALFDGWFEGAKALPETFNRDMQDRTSLAARALSAGRESRGTAYAAFNSWQDTINLIFGGDKTGAGDRLIDTLGLEVSDLFQERKGIVRRATEQFTNEGMRAFGFTKAQQFIDRMAADSKKIDLGTFYNAAGKEVKLQLSKAEARKRWMEMQDPTLAETITGANGNAYSPSMVRAVDNFLTPEDKAFAQAQLDFYRWFYPQINEVYSRYYGVNLPNNPNYSPISREHHDVNNPMFAQDMAYRRSVAPGSLKSRVAATSPLKDMADFNVLQRHIAEMAHFMTFADKVQELGSVFGDPRITNVIDDRFSKAITRNIKDYMQDFRGGQIRQLNEGVNLAEMLRQNFTVAVLGFKPALTIKNFTSFLTYGEFLPAAEFAKGLSDFAKNPVKAAKVLSESELFKARGDTLDRDIMLAFRGTEFGRWRKLQSFRNFMLWFTKAGDIASIAAGGWPVYRYHRNVLGESHEDALKAFDRATALTRSSSDLDQLSRLQASPSVTARTITMLMSDTNQLYRREMRAILDGVRGKITPGQMAKRVFLYHFLIPMFYQFVADFGEWDEENQLRAAIFGSLNGAFILYDIMDGIVRHLQGERVFSRTAPAVQWAQEMGKGLSGFDANDVFSDESVEAMWKMLDGGGKLIGLPLGRLEQMADAVEDFRYGDAAAGVARLLGFPNSVADNLIEGNED